MRPALSVVLLAVGAVVAAALLLALFVWVPPAPTPVPACGREPTTPDFRDVPAGETEMLYGIFGSPVRLTVWSNASATYSLYLQNQSQYSAYAENGTGENGSVHTTPPSDFYWTSGPATATNSTFQLGGGGWYFLASNPQPDALVVNFVSVECGPPAVQ